MAKLNENKIKEIRDLYNTGEYTQKELSVLYSISRPTITMIVNNQIWKEIK